MEIVKVWKAHGDGGERNVSSALCPILGISKDKSTSIAMAKGKGWWSADGAVVEATAIEDVNGLLYLLVTPEPFEDGIYQSTTKDRARQAALAKLTDEDLQALGIERK